MADNRFRNRDDDPGPTCTPDSDLIEATTLQEVLFTYPGAITVNELIRELTFGSHNFGERDQIECAVRGLVASGLFHLNGNFVIPTRAAVKFWSLRNV